MVNRPSELINMTWEEVERVLEDTDYVIVPVGSCEQHSLHLMLQTDAALAYEVSTRIVEKSSPDLKLLIAPTIPIGWSEHHMHFSGTLTLRPETLLAIISDICRSLKRHKIKNVVLINGHGGNRTVLEMAATRLQRELDMNVLIFNYWTLATDVIRKEVQSQTWGHSCEVETSIAMHLLPETVKRERIRKPKVKSRYIIFDSNERFSSAPVRYWEDLTDTGATGDPTKASKELGAKLIDVIVTRIIYSLRQFKERNSSDFLIRPT